MNSFKGNIFCFNYFANRKKEIIFIFFGFYAVISILTRMGSGSKRSKPLPYQQYLSKMWLLQDSKLILNISNCKIPYFDPYEPEVRNGFLWNISSSEKDKCRKGHYNWSRVERNILLMDQKRMQIDGNFSIRNNLCCYIVIERKKISLIKSENTNMDTSVIYSDCIPINGERTRIKAEFVKVECSNEIGTEISYRAFHATPFTTNSSKLLVKIKHWGKKNKKKKKDKKNNKNKIQKKNEERPPNVLIIGQDSTSRVNFRRQMHQTRSILEKLGAVEMLGYTKVGENTYPNIIPALTGYSREELAELFGDPKSVKADDYPLIWKRFDAVNYITEYIEDDVQFGNFNYLKKGFVQPPTDFYIRPLFYANAQQPKSNLKQEGCIGYQSYDEMLTSYQEKVLDFANYSQTPFFSLSWSSGAAKSSLNGLQTVDQTYANFLENLKKKGYLENTILFFMGDHGLRHPSFLETQNGYFEYKLPNMWIRLGSKVKHRFPNWQKALEINANRVTSPYTLYWTLNLILRSFNPKLKPVEDVFSQKNNKTLTRKVKKYNFFKTIPESAECSLVGVPVGYCTCYSPAQILPLDDPTLQAAANYAVNWINKNGLKLEGWNQRRNRCNCSALKVSKVEEGIVMPRGRDLLRYYFALITSPGSFQYEVALDYDKKNKQFKNSIYFLRMGDINPGHVIGLWNCQFSGGNELYCYNL